jgi:hypothetical protein
MTATTADRTFGLSEDNAASYSLVPDTEELVSDEADDLVIALLARERLARGTDHSLSLEDSMRSLGVDPADFGLE